MSHYLRSGGSAMPGKIEACLETLRHLQCGAQGAYDPVTDRKGEPRALTPLERRVEDAALSTLLEYFNSAGFGEPIANRHDDGPMDGPAKLEGKPV